MRGVEVRHVTLGRKLALTGAMSLAALVLSPALVESASAYPAEKLVGVAIVDGAAYLVYETPAGGFFFELI